MHGRKRTVEEWQAFYDEFDLDVNKSDCLLDPQPSTYEELLDEFGPYGFHMMYVKWNDREINCDATCGWRLYDMKVADPKDGYFLELSPEFPSIAEALDYPVLDGKSIRERIGECRFYGE